MIIIAQFEGISLTSRAIRWITRSRDSHTAALWIPEDPTNAAIGQHGILDASADVLAQYFTHDLVTGVPCIEAWHRGGVQLSHSISTRHTRGTIVHLYVVNCLPALQQAVWYGLCAEAGKRYDLLAVSGFLTRRQRRDRSPDRWMCSELVFHKFMVGGCRLLNEIEPHNVHPGHIPLSTLLMHVRTVTTL